MKHLYLSKKIFPFIPQTPLLAKERKARTRFYRQFCEDMSSCTSFVCWFFVYNFVTLTWKHCSSFQGDVKKFSQNGNNRHRLISIIPSSLMDIWNECAIAEELHVEYCDDSIQPLDWRGVGRALQGDLRVWIRLLENRHIPIFGCRVSCK